MNILSLKDIKEAYTGLTPVTEILYMGEKVWPTDSGDWVLIDNEYISDASGFYHEKLVKYGESIPGVTYETPGGTRTTYGFVEDTETTIEKLDGYTYLMSDNKGKDATWAQVKLMWSDIPDWTLHIMSDAESTYDYLCVSDVDDNEWTSLPNPGIGARTTSGKQGNWIDIAVPGSGSHHLYVAFRKDGSVGAGKDRGYIYFISEKKEILDTKAGALLPYEYIWYHDVIIDGGKTYQKLEYTATLPNGEQVINEDNYIRGEEIEPITEFGGLSLMNADSKVVNIGFRYFKNGVSLEYAVKDTTPWLPFDITTTVALNPGDIMYVKGVNDSLGVEAASNSTTFSMSGPISASGNIMSLLYGEDYEGKDTVGAFAFSHLFEQCTSLTTAPELPATNLSRYCYNQMFYNCRALAIAPALPATTVKEWSYRYMFHTCVGLTTPPTLPATNIEQYCYERMFSECTSLTTAPALPATNLAMLCYDGMFNGCYALTAAPALPATNLVDYCYRNMFTNCRALTTAPALPATNLADYCYQEMFSGCSRLTTPPALPATILKQNCYSSMFENCYALTAAPELPATNLATRCYQNMFRGCSALTTPPTLPATNLADYCYINMFRGCSVLTTPPALPATTLTSGCYNQMFYNCYALTTAPALPATILKQYCYQSMFDGCKKLTDITCYADDISASGCLNQWVNDVASTGTFHKLGTAEYPEGVSGIPGGWTVVTE